MKLDRVKYEYQHAGESWLVEFKPDGEGCWSIDLINCDGFVLVNDWPASPRNKPSRTFAEWLIRHHIKREA